MYALSMAPRKLAIISSYLKYCRAFWTQCITNFQDSCPIHVSLPLPPSQLSLENLSCGESSLFMPWWPLGRHTVQLNGLPCTQKQAGWENCSCFVLRYVFLENTVFLRRPLPTFFFSFNCWNTVTSSPSLDFDSFTSGH